MINLTVNSFYYLDLNNPFPMVRTQRNNVPFGKLHNQKEDKVTYFVKKSLPITGRKFEYEACSSDLEQIYKLGQNDLILIRGITGSGKSHFIRKVLQQFLESNRELRSKNGSRPIIFASYQTPISFAYPINGFKSIFKEIYFNLKTINKTKSAYSKTFNGVTYEFTCDIIGRLVIESESYSYINYLNEVLDADLLIHFESLGKFAKDFIIADLPKIDPYFQQRKFDKIEKYILEFFYRMITLYQQQQNENQTNQINFPIFPYFL